MVGKQGVKTGRNKKVELTERKKSTINEQIKELEETVNKVPCDIIVDGTPANLKRIIKVKKPIVEVDYELGKNAVDELKKILKNKKLIR